MSLLEQLHTITSGSAPFNRKVEQLLHLGCDRFCQKLGVVGSIKQTTYTVEFYYDKAHTLSEGMRLNLRPLFCADTIAQKSTLAACYVMYTGLTEASFIGENPPKGYIGAPIFVDNRIYGTVSFYSAEPNCNPDLQEFLDFVTLLAQWIGQALTQQSAEQELQRRSDALTSVGELAQIGWWEVDLVNRTVYWSDEIRAIHEVDSDYIPELETAIQFYKHGEDRERINKAVEHAIRLGRAWNLEARLITARGREIWVNASGKPFYQNGECIKLFGALQNVDDMVRLRLAHDSKRKEAEAHLHARNAFLAKVSHELRTPINGINGMLQALRGEQDMGTIERRTNITLKSAASLVELINEVLDYSKVQHGELTLQKQPFNLHDVFAQAVAVYQSLCESKGLAFESQIHFEDDVWVMGDKLRLTQILSNLLSNAVKFTDSGSVAIKAVLQDSAHAVVLRVVVQDTGIGIAYDAQNQLFQPFQQVNSDVARYGGTGLGLSIVKELCKQMLGDVQVRSELNQGSAFSFSVTLEKAQAQQAENDQYIVPNLSSLGLKILVVDDNEINREVMQALLDKLQLQADYAIDGHDAIHKVTNAETPYDFIFMDVVMPGMDGLTATRRIRELNAGQLINITALTANTTQTDKKSCYSAGMNGFIAKPVTLDLLVESLQCAPRILATYR